MDISKALSAVEQPIRQVLQLGFMPISIGPSASSSNMKALKQQAHDEKVWFRPGSLALMAWAYDISSYGRGIVELSADRCLIGS